jgi:hypothetical protein
MLRPLGESLNGRQSRFAGVGFCHGVSRRARRESAAHNWTAVQFANSLLANWTADWRCADVCGLHPRTLETSAPTLHHDWLPTSPAFPSFSPGTARHGVPARRAAPAGCAPTDHALAGCKVAVEAKRYPTSVVVRARLHAGASFKTFARYGTGTSWWSGTTRTPAPTPIFKPPSWLVSPLPSVRHRPACRESGELPGGVVPGCESAP